MLIEKMLFFFIALFGLSILIIIHEAGHFLFCKLFKIPAPIFSLGMGPKIFSRTYNGTEFRIGAIPLGGYVAIGETKESEEHNDIDVLQRYSFFQGFFVLLGGIICNFIFAYLVCAGLAITKNLENTSLKLFLSTSTIESVLEGSLAEKMGILPGDCVVSINGQVVKSPLEIRPLFSKMTQSQSKIVCISRNGSEIFCTDTSNPDESQTTVGVTCAIESYSDLSLSERALYGIKIASLMIQETVNGVIDLVKNHRVKNFSGFIGIVRVGINAAQQSIAALLATLALISVNLAVINLIPLPILDGGQLLMFAFAKLYGRPLSERFRTIFLYFSIILIALLTIFTTFYDIMRWIGWA